MIKHTKTFAVVILIGLTLARHGLAAPATAPANERVFNVHDYGAAGNGKTLDTAALQAAVDACAKAGGGQVRVPPGDYLTATVRLRSHVTLVLEEAARLVGFPDCEQYQSYDPPRADGKVLPSRWHRALLLGVDVEDVTITGRGVLDGNNVFDAQGEEKMRGPHGILFANSRNITLRDFAIRDASNYAVMLITTSNVEACGLKITGGWDGIHFRGSRTSPCRNVTITDCQFYTGDDCIAGWHWEDTLISGCIINSSCNGIRLIGPAKNLIVHDCLFFGPGRFEHRTSRDKHRTNMLAGLCLQPGAWEPTQGPLDGVKVSNVTMHDVTTPLHLSIKPGNVTGRINIDRLTATGVYRAAASVENWSDVPIEQVTLRDWSVTFTGGGTKEQAAREVKAPGVDARSLPAWGLFAKNVGSLKLENVRLSLDAPDARPAMLLQDVAELGLDGLRLPVTAESVPAVLERVSGVTVRDAGMEVVPCECIDLAVQPNPLVITTTVQGGRTAGLARVELSVDERKLTRWVWLGAGEKKPVIFSNVESPGPREHVLRCGTLTRKLGGAETPK